MGSLFFVVMIIIVASFYFIIGFGFSKMVSKIKDREANLFELLAWPIAAVVFAACGDIN